MRQKQEIRVILRAHHCFCYILQDFKQLNAYIRAHNISKLIPYNQQTFIRSLLTQFPCTSKANFANLQFEEEYYNLHSVMPYASYSVPLYHNYGVSTSTYQYLELHFSIHHYSESAFPKMLVHFQYVEYNYQSLFAR